MLGAHVVSDTEKEQFRKETSNMTRCLWLLSFPECGVSPGGWGPLDTLLLLGALQWVKHRETGLLTDPFVLEHLWVGVFIPNPHYPGVDNKRPTNEGAWLGSPRVQDSGTYDLCAQKLGPNTPRPVGTGTH